jgi:hypothetical protein
MTRGDRKRNARRERLRGLLPRDGAVIGIDLAEDKQAIAVIDHDVRVVARKTVRVKAFRLGEALDWAAGQARARGFVHVTVACEPTGAGGYFRLNSKYISNGTDDMALSSARDQRIKDSHVPAISSADSRSAAGQPAASQQ